MLSKYQVLKEIAAFVLVTWEEIQEDAVDMILEYVVVRFKSLATLGSFLSLFAYKPVFQCIPYGKLKENGKWAT